jgi:thiamine biosynthesis protein ThiS
MPLEIRLNGERREVPEGGTVGDLLEELDLDPRAVVVERNREILRGEERGDVVLEPGDEIEIVQFVGGG